MPVSQLRVFSNYDASAPQLTGGVQGNYLAVLNAILVDGYGTTDPAGWSKPIPDSGNMGCFQQGAGSSGLYLFVNDASPNGVWLTRSAWVVGWHTLSAITGPVGVGGGQFPTPAQSLTNGHLIAYKSNTVDSVERPWVCFADSRTFYLFVLTGDVAATYWQLWFGDIFSFKVTPDAYKVMLHASNSENSPATGTTVHWDAQVASVTTAMTGRFLARTFGGGGGSIAYAVQGDIGRSGGSSTLTGGIQTPNGPDNSFYLSPIHVLETSTGLIRGRYRGLFQFLNNDAVLSDGQTLEGQGDYNGRRFQVVKMGPNGTVILVEISNTVETN